MRRLRFCSNGSWLIPLALVSSLALAAAGCGGSDSDTEGGGTGNSGFDAGMDVNQDDSGTDVNQPDTGIDAGTDVTEDVTQDVAEDGGADAEDGAADGNEEASTDAQECEATGEEVCNGIDDDCDGETDEGNPGGGAECSTGLDGICSKGTMTCIKGTLSCVPDHGPGEVQETCNQLDDDCDGFIDEGLPKKTFYKDDDGDGYGTDATIQACAAPQGYSDKGNDCNDNNPNIHPGAIETCNEIDDNCNGAVDEGVQKPTFFKDNDGDGWGGVTMVYACKAPDGYVKNGGDCNDFNKNIYPGAPEQCNNIDDDCNGLTDDNVQTHDIYKDNDGDGFAAPNAAHMKKCDTPNGWTTAKDPDGDGKPNWDCDDSNANSYPYAPEKCDGLDNNCDGFIDSHCPGSCPGSWPVTIPIGSHMPARLLDYNGDSIDELYVIDRNGKLRKIAQNGTVTTVCNNLTFSTGYGNRFAWTVNPALDNNAYGYLFVQGTRIYNLSTCKEIKHDAKDVSAFGSVGDFDGDHVLDYAGHNENSKTICFKLSSKGFRTYCADSPNGKHYDGYLASFDVDHDGRSEVVTIRGRTFPNSSYYDGSIDVWGWNGSKLVVERTIAPSVTGSIGVHMSGLNIADYYNNGFAKVTAIFNGKVFDLNAGKVLVAKGPGGGIPIPRLYDLNGDNKLDKVIRGALVELNGSGNPESVKAYGQSMGVYANPDGKALDGWPVTLGTFTWSVDPVVGDVDNDGHLDVFVPSSDGVVYCYRLGEGSARHTNVINRGDYAWVNRTMVQDFAEPNNSVQTAWPMHFPTKEIRAFLTKGDVDYYRVKRSSGIYVKLYSPEGLDYDIYWYNEDGTKLYGKSTKPAGQVDSSAVCVGCTQTTPPSYVIKIVPKNPAKDYSASKPYVLSINRLP